MHTFDMYDMKLLQIMENPMQNQTKAGTFSPLFHNLFKSALLHVNESQKESSCHAGSNATTNLLSECTALAAGHINHCIQVTSTMKGKHLGPSA